MTDHIGEPIPRGVITDDAPLVDDALAAKIEQPASDAADTVSALKAELEELKSTFGQHQEAAARQARTVVRSHPLTSLLGASLIGYVLALAIHGPTRASTRSWNRFR